MKLHSLASRILFKHDWRNAYVKTVEDYALAGSVEGLTDYDKSPFNFAYDLHREIVLQREGVQSNYATPIKVAARMAKLAEINAGDTVLDPCAGIGALLKCASALGANTIGYENQYWLWSASKFIGNFHIIYGDFNVDPPSWRSNIQPDVILLNPPVGEFSRADTSYKMLMRISVLYKKPRVVALLPYGYFGKKSKRRTLDRLDGRYDVNKIVKVPSKLLRPFVERKMALYHLTLTGFEEPAPPLRRIRRKEKSNV